MIIVRNLGPGLRESHHIALDLGPQRGVRLKRGQLMTYAAGQIWSDYDVAEFALGSENVGADPATAVSNTEDLSKHSSSSRLMTANS